MIPIFKVTHFRNAKSTLLTPQQLFMLLRFFVYSEKSVFAPSQRLTFLGFDLDSVHMTVAHTAAKIKKLFASCNSLLQKTTPTIRLAAELSHTNQPLVFGGCGNTRLSVCVATAFLVLRNLPSCIYNSIEICAVHVFYFLNNNSRKRNSRRHVIIMTLP